MRPPSDFCVPHGAKIRALTREGRFSAKVASLTGPLQRTREGCDLRTEADP